MEKKKESVIKKKDERFSIKIKPADKLIIQQRAKNAGYKSTSKYIRDILLKTEIVPRADIDLILQVRKIGVNINQVVHLCNELKTESILTNTYDDLKKNVDELILSVSKILYKQ